MSEESTTYVVQVLAESQDGMPVLWRDLATITVPIRTTRRTVIKKALEQAGISPNGEPPKVRALDAESAEVHEPAAFTPPTEWRVP